MLIVIFMDCGKNNEAIKRPEMVFLYVLYEQFNYNCHLINSF